MLTRVHNMFGHYDGPAPDETLQLERDGHCVARDVFSGEEIRALRQAVLEVYDRYPSDLRENIPNAQDGVFRYQMINRSVLCQRVIGHPRILDIIEPLIGGDCHVINSTAWRNPPGGVADPHDYYWHIDGGPHVPRPQGVDWPDAIPYPVFVIATHIYLEDCTFDDGPTSVVPGSHRSGLFPPPARRFDEVLAYRGRTPVTHVVQAGDVGFFVSDVWHRRRLPTERSAGRLFLQTNYGRRDIAQRILPVSEGSQVSEEVRLRAMSEREQTLIGIHPAGFYDG